MQEDIRQSPRYREAEALHRKYRKPGTGYISDAADVSIAPEARHAVFAGTLVEKLEGSLPTRICKLDMASGEVRVLTFGPGIDRLPRYSPDGKTVAFLSDRHQGGDFQLYLLDPSTGVAQETARVDGWVEYLHWSPDGTRILLGVAGHGADVAGGQGAVSSGRAVSDAPAWMPEVKAGGEGFRWRRAWIYDVSRNVASQVPGYAGNVWEVVWCGNDAMAVVTSSEPGEGAWYRARLHLVSCESGQSRDIYVPKRQIGFPAVSPSGKYVAIIDALCSDRGIVAGDVKLIEPSTGVTRSVDTADVDVTSCEWRSDNHLLVSGHRGFESVVGLCDATTGCYREVWRSDVVSTGGIYMHAAGFGEPGDCVLVTEGFTQPPEIGAVRQGVYEPIRRFDVEYAIAATKLLRVQKVAWLAKDGLDVQGWLLLPSSDGPHPVVMFVHGGPVWLWRPTWLGRRVQVLMLVSRGYAIFMPNPRGSTGRGQDYIARVCGDLGGADAQDLLAGLDALVERGWADPKRLGVMGNSYGGFMSSWLITQDPRFAAAIPTSPHTNQVTEYLLSNISSFLTVFLGERYDDPRGLYLERSPVMHARKARTPTLNICGALDRCTPPEEAHQFHSALCEQGVKSVLVTYPQEGHGVRNFPASIDAAARIVGWFEEHMLVANSKDR